jgi:hypothetical protein
LYSTESGKKANGYGAVGEFGEFAGLDLDGAGADVGCYGVDGHDVFLFLLCFVLWEKLPRLLIQNGSQRWRNPRNSTTGDLKGRSRTHKVMDLGGGKICPKATKGDTEVSPFV